jgi:hypothetical protein
VTGVSQLFASFLRISMNVSGAKSEAETGGDSGSISGLLGAGPERRMLKNPALRGHINAHRIR